ncbi:hypothetical protein HY484_02660 [Candidatus Woesearchaeota archaeon]|nr:hypothetical protein [Candidatus Woesearchaeota archaeon]
MMNKGIFFVATLLFLGIIVVIIQGDGIKGLATDYLTETKGYVCEGNYCFQCVINEVPCFCETEICVCGGKTVDKKLCTVKLLWQEMPED